MLKSLSGVYDTDQFVPLLLSEEIGPSRSLIREQDITIAKALTCKLEL